MTVYLVRWEAGAIAFVDAASKRDALVRLDEFDGFDPKYDHIEKLDDFMMEFAVRFDQEKDPELLDFAPGAAIGGRLYGPTNIGECCRDDID